MKRFISGTLYGDTWMEGRGYIEEFFAEIPKGVHVRELIRKIVNACDDFQPRSKRFSPETAVVFQYDNFAQQGSRVKSCVTQRRVLFKNAPSLLEFVEVNRRVH